jgi:thioredoxin 1
MSLKIVDDSSFDKEVLKSDLPVLVDFSATWCAPCKKQLPVLEEAQNEYKDSVKIVKIDIDDSPESAGKFRVRSVPTIMLFKHGVPVKNHVGLISKPALQKFLNE